MFIAPIIWGFMLALAACGGRRGGEDFPDAGRPETPPDKPERGETPLSDERHPYESADPFLPQATRNGVFYHPFFTRENKPAATLSRPLALECGAQENRCTFAAGTQLFSFPNDADALANNDSIPLTLLTDFSPEVDGENTRLADVVVDGAFIYALYEGAESGIAGRSLVRGERLEGFPFRQLAPRRAVAPTDLFAFDSQLWVAASNPNWRDGRFPSGTVFGLARAGDGTLTPLEGEPFRTSRVNPRKLATWDQGDGSLLLLCANANHVTPDDRIAGPGSMDLFNPNADGTDPVASIPLGEFAPDHLLMTSDNAAAFAGSMARHWISVIDLSWVSGHLGEDDLGAAPLADADNPVRLYPAGSPFETGAIRSLAYAEDRRRFLASTSHETLIQLRGGHALATGGMVLETGFGFVTSHYFCNGDETQGCGPVAFLEHGAIALTENPAAVTYLPNASLD